MQGVEGHLLNSCTNKVYIYCHLSCRERGIPLATPQHPRTLILVDDRPQPAEGFSVGAGRGAWLRWGGCGDMGQADFG